ncbi:MAG: mechanosensitive ion channel, partial [Anaerolineae bacterium]|nr:mechanosensitive ion channel [Anaerolineae bacterium]
MQQFMSLLVEYGVNLGVAALILIGGWLLALIISSAVRAALGRTQWDNQLAARMGVSPTVNVENIAGQIMFWIVMLFVIMTVFNFLNLPAVTGPINRLLDEVFAFIPNILAAGGLLLLAWLIATALRFLITKALGMTGLDDTMTNQLGMTQAGQKPMSEVLANIVYWFVFLLFLGPVLNALGMQGLLGPVEGMVNDLLGALPNILKAALIFLIGWFVARIIRQIVTSFLAAVGADNLGERVGLSAATGGQSLSNVIGTVVYSIVLIVVVISALDALQIAAIS